MSLRQTRRSRSAAQIFALPLAIAVLALGGLIAGLAGDGLHDVAAWLLLAPGPVAFFWAWAKRA